MSNQQSEENQDDCFCIPGETWATWRELIHDYLAMFAMVSSGIAGAGLGSGTHDASTEAQAPPPPSEPLPPSNATCGVDLQAAFVPIVSSWYSILSFILFISL